MPRKQGQHTPFSPAQNRASGQHKLWRTMRVLRAFTVGDIVATAETPRRTVHCYIVRLARVEYLRREKRLGNDPQVYRLVRDTGPFAPMLRRDGTVFDPNINSVVGDA